MTDAAARLRRALPVLFTSVALAALGTFLVLNHRHITENYALRPGAFLLMAFLILATFALRSSANRILFGTMEVKASWGDWFRLLAVSSFTNYLPFSAGLAVKALYLKGVHTLPYRRFIAGQTALLALAMSTNGAAGLAALAVGFREEAVGVIGAGFIIMVASAGLLLLPDSLARRFKGHRILGEIGRIPPIRRVWGRVALLQAGSLLAGAATLKISFDMGPAEVSFPACLIFTAAAILTRLVSITPGAIGIRELLVGGLAHLVGFEMRDAVIAATLSRLIEMAVVFFLGAIFTFGFSSRLTSTNDE